jgi:hypothetical protein
LAGGFSSLPVSSLWLQKLVLLDTYRRLHTHLRWEKLIMIAYIGIFAATYVTVQIVTFTECDPFNHYWQVLPDPGMSSLFSLVSIHPNKLRHMLPGTAPTNRPRYAVQISFNNTPLLIFVQASSMSSLT